MFLSLYFLCLLLEECITWFYYRKYSNISINVFPLHFTKLFLKSVKKLRMELAIGKSPNNIDYNFVVHY